MAENIMSTTESTTTAEYLQQHAIEIVESISADSEPIVITLGDRPKAVLLDVEQYREFKEHEQTRKDLALLKILEERYERAKNGPTYTVDEVFDRIEKKLRERAR